MKSPKSLKELSCIAAVSAGVLTDDVLAQPDYRELIHRALPKREQIKLLNESREYGMNGRLEHRSIYNPDGTKCYRWFLDPYVYAYIKYVFYGPGTKLEILFYRKGDRHTGIKSITLENSNGFGFYLSHSHYGISLHPTFKNKSHGIVHDRVCLSVCTDTGDLKRYYRHQLSNCKCEGVRDEYTLCKRGKTIATMITDLELD
jgi:hypothetical protein